MWAAQLCRNEGEVWSWATGGVGGGLVVAGGEGGWVGGGGVSLMGLGGRGVAEAGGVAVGCVAERLMTVGFCTSAAVGGWCGAVAVVLGG